VLSLRQVLYLSLEDLLYITWEWINSDVSRSDIACLEDVTALAEGETILAELTLQGLRTRLYNDFVLIPAGAGSGIGQN